MKIWVRFLALLSVCIPSIAFSGSVHLYNDSPFKLRAVIRGADGMHLGEMIVYPRHQAQWTDAYGHVGRFGHSNMLDEQSTFSQTPYTILWYCMDGNEYSVNDNVPTAATISAQAGTGVRECKQLKKKKGPFPNQPQSNLSEYSHKDNDCNCGEGD
jgi:hypothetical protein